MAKAFQFGIEPITCHAWNDSKTKIALSLNSSEVNIYKIADSDWILEDTLKGHDLRVTGIDWAAKTNRIVTCGADRNAYVWTQADVEKWEPTLVLLRINRAATCVKWSPSENKFAVGSAARLISVCYFEQENNWWVSKHIKKPIRSTITTLDWHPNNVLLATGAADFKVRIFSAWIKDIEPKPVSNAWGSKMPLGQLMAEFSNSTGGGGWVHCVSFSADGSKVCWVGHDSSVSVAVAADQDICRAQLKTEYLPFTCITWISLSVVIAAGHGCCPMIYRLRDNFSLEFIGKLDVSQKKEAGSISAMRKFQALDRTARTDSSDTTLATIHQNTITDVQLFSGTKASATAVSTCGADSQLVIWDFRSLEQLFPELKIC